MVKATFHYSIQLQTENLVFDQVCDQVFDKFVRVSDTLSTSFLLFLSKTWSRTCCINLDMSRMMQQVRWFVRVLDKWNVEKNRFEPANEPVEAGFSLVILLFLECTDPYRLVSLASNSGNRVIRTIYLCLSLIYCLTHVECFRLLEQSILFEASLQLAFDLLSTCFRPACDTLTQVCDQVCSQVCSLLE